MRQPHPSSFILYPSPFIVHPSSFRDRKFRSSRPLVPGPDVVADPVDAGVPQRVIGVGRARAAMAIRRELGIERDPALLEQPVDGLRRLEAAALEKFRPFDA